MSIRSGNYSHNEDVLLCEVYKQISQDPAKGKDQSSKAFWARVEEGFNASKDDAWEIRSARSLEARIQIIEKAVRKFHGCIRTSEALRRSGTNNEDVMKKAIELFTEDPKYKKGWKFHHVWSTIGDFEKFKDCSKGSKKKMRNHNSSASENEIPDPQDSQGMSSFSMNLGDDDDDNYEISGSSSRPIGQKKAKNKAKKDEATASLISKLRSDNKQFLEEMKTSNELFKEQMEKKNAFREMKEENKILFQDSSLIQDPRYRAFVESEQARILQKRAQQSSQPDPFATGFYSAYFNNLGGSSSDIPPY